MRDFETYLSASREIFDALVEYDKSRVEREALLAKTRTEQDAVVSAKSELRKNAREAATKIGATKPEPGVHRAHDDRIGSAIFDVGKAFYTYGGFFEKMQRKSDAARAGRYLLAAEPLLAEEIAQLKVKHSERLEAMELEQQRAASVILKQFDRYRQAVSEYAMHIGAPALATDDAAWQETAWGTADFQNVIRLVNGYKWVDGQKVAVPVFARVPGESIYVYPDYFPAARKNLVNDTLVRALRSASPGKLKLLLIDPTSLGETFSPLLSLSEYSEEILHTKVWTSEGDIRARLEEASDRVGLIIQKYLTDQYPTLDEYNDAAGEVTEPNVVVAINDFPLGLDARSIEIVKSLLDVGPRCGLSLILLQAESIPKEAWATVSDAGGRAQIRMGTFNVDEVFTQRGTYGSYAAQRSLGQVREKLPSWLDIWSFGTGAAERHVPVVSYIQGKSRLWHAEPLTPIPAEVVDSVLETVGRGFAGGARVEVRLERVWDLFAEAHGPAQQAPSLNEDAHWWTASSLEGITVPVGRRGSRGVTTLTFDSKLHSSALVVGRPGSGKSNLLNVVISTLAAFYPPDELQLYLLDFKEAVEFAAYAAANLPHARAIALEADREFGLAVLRHLGSELERRGRLFRDSVGEQSNLVSYRTTTGAGLPRVLLLIDEFHRLFDREDTIASEAAKHLDDLIRLGRGFGLHCLLASQTLMGMSALGRHTLNQVAIRVALQCSDEDSRIIFSEDNSAAALLTRPGEAIFNAGGGRAANNEPFQVPLLADEARVMLLEKLAARAVQAGPGEKPRVYRKGVLAEWRPGQRQSSQDVPVIRLGDAVALEPAFGYELRRESGRNILVVGRSEEVAGGMLAAGLAGLRTSYPGLDVTVLDLMAIDGPVDKVARSMGLAVNRRREFAACIARIAGLVEGREPSRTLDDPTHVLLINGIGKVRDLDPEDYSDEAQELATRFHAILRDGPEVGVHVLAWCDSVTSLERRLGRRMEREFGARAVFAMTAEDSLRLCDSEAATDLDEREAILADIDRGTSVKFQPYAAPAGDELLEPVGV